ncbi:MAG: hypothetical protein AAGI38_02400 [Bacteroidota bacterium]
MLPKKSFSWWLIFLVAGIHIWWVSDVRIYRHETRTAPIESDGLGYYMYLPSAFIYHDFDPSFVGTMPEYKESFKPLPYIFHLSPHSGKRVNKYTPGLAVIWTPFFLGAHLLAAPLGYEANGFTIPYRVALLVAALAFHMLGFFYLRKTLLSYFQEKVTVAVMLVIGLGTNLLYYTLQDPTMPHVYSFTLVMMMVYHCIEWHKQGKWADMGLMALAAGFMVLIRPINGLYLLFPLLYGISSIADFGRKARHVGSHWKQLALGIGIGMITLSPMFIYWKEIAGSWLYISYTDEGFLWDQPEWIKVLFSYQKGWLVYTPIMLLAFAGIFWIDRYAKGWLIPLLVFFPLNLYLISSWWSWWYGGGFGMRALIEAMAPLSISVGAFFAWAFEQRWRAILAGTFTFLCINLNLLQSYQFFKVYIHWSGTTKKSYWAAFGRFYIPPDEQQRIIHEYAQEPDHEARLGKFRAKKAQQE